MSGSGTQAPAAETRSGAAVIDPAIAAEQTRLLYDNLPAGLAGTVLIAAILAALLVGDIPGARIALWMGLMLAVNGARYGLLLAYRRHGADDDGRWQHRFEIGSFSSGLVWAAASLFLFPADPVRQAFMGFVLGSMAAGAVSTLGVHLRAYSIYLLPALVPYTAMLLSHGGGQQFGMGLVFALGQVVLLVSARRFSELTVRGLSLRHENDNLVAALRSALDTANDASKAKSRFLANMSHEIRTPMNGVLGMTDVLARTTLDPRQSRMVSTIGQSARTLLTIIDDILDLARIEEGRLKPEPHAFALAPAVEDVVALLADLAERKGLVLTLGIDGKLPAMVEGDSGRLRQVLLNLIGNAIKFTETGEVAVRVTPVEAGRQADTIRFEVRDTGIGMTADTQAQIFQPFVQADSSIRRRFGGSGLGLAISHHLVKLMGGTMTLTSTPGAGTTLAVSLPLAALGETCVCEAESRLAGRRILVVDPVATRRAISAGYLAEAGAEVTAVATPAEAARFAAGSKVDLVVAADQPQSRPGETAAGAAVAPALHGTPTIALVAMSDAATTGANAGSAGSLRVVLPVRRVDLVAVARDALAGRGRADAPAAPDTEAVRVPQLRLDVLVAEDNPVNQLVAEDYLTTLGCTVTMVGDGQEAVDMARARRFDVILMDCQMPVLDGLAATRQVRELERAMHRTPTPVVAVTANAYAEDRRQCLDAGMDDFIAKPFAMEMLMETLLRWRPPTSSGTDKGKAAA